MMLFPRSPTKGKLPGLFPATPSFASARGRQMFQPLKIRDEFKWEFTAAGVFTGAFALCWSPELSLFIAGSVTTSDMAWSRDGLRWTVATTPDSTSRWRAACWSQRLRKAVVVGSAGTNRWAVSYDGRNWIGGAMPSASVWHAVEWVDELRLFVAVHASGGTSIVATSPDGENWTARTTPNVADAIGIAWSPYLRRAVITSRTVTIVSAVGDLTTWSSVANANSTDYYGVAWSPALGMFAQAGYQAVSGSSIQYSYDGLVWRQARNEFGTAFVTSAVMGMVWIADLGVFIATGNSVATAFVSRDGVYWKELTPPSAIEYRNPCWSPKLRKLVTARFIGSSFAIGRIGAA